ncbi:MAG TPA: thiol-disulfide oxidoreductase DCC family protein [Niabella sp.]|nr:thiol-disulfide oxidoreductase DCC family protein [Niabella sp.]HOZ97623.1 thiol-disulfide oxidoreductase DCC family protein [Niabella sp.]HQW15761.1 thiol-disulfide oxidoreductase DCC family protein [Niabella sp.]HRB36256.1 thiol-disulfide oxidoreductase DCC family protein [Niabella sp.]HRB44023.1 thiol-disulfide oxidoreductase DCC family protein [Niabella sp.]
MDTILFDGSCYLCNSAVQFVIKRDAKKVFHFASLQSPVGKQLLKSYSLPENLLDSFVYIQNQRAFIKSDAALKVVARLGYPTKILVVFIIIPKFLRDWVYDIIARNRYKIWGQKKECMMPSSELEKRILKEIE